MKKEKNKKIIDQLHWNMFTIVATRHQRKSYVTTAGIQSFQLQYAGRIRVEKRNQTYIYIYIFEIRCNQS